MTTAPRRWFRFSLRTLFVVVTMICLISSARFAWRPSWIDARREFRDRQDIEWADTCSFPTQRALATMPRTSPSAGYAFRFTLWFYGEREASRVRVPIRVGSLDRIFPKEKTESNADKKITAAARLFPEATVDAIPVIVWPGRDPRRTPLRGNKPIIAVE